MWASNFFSFLLLTVERPVKIGVPGVREVVLVVAVRAETVAPDVLAATVLVLQCAAPQIVILVVKAHVNLVRVVLADVRIVIIGQAANVVETTVKDVTDVLEHVMVRAPTIVKVHV